MIAQRKILGEVCIIRVIVIFLLVLYHSFAPFCGAWTPLGDSMPKGIYYWLALVSYSFMLEAFVFISGYIFGFQIREKGKIDTKNIILNKLKRIILPSLLFSYIYMLFFNTQERSLNDWFIGVFSGAGHLWFLPMLFWCFILTILIENKIKNYRIALVLVVIFSLISLVKLPLRLNQSFNYLMFFYAGFILRRNDLAIEKFCNKKTILFVGLLYVIAMIIGIYMKSVFPDGTLFGKIVKFSYAILGVIFIFLLAYYLVNIRQIVLSPWFINLSNICFGVYVFQEFILRIIYYKSSLSVVLDINILPWIAFLITIILSVGLTVIVRKNYLGRLLLG